ncbi:MAG: hypothetical protein Q4G28_02095 [Neisseria sp.]|nr:hypothetical protein [Neisseria sp.]
MNLSPSVYPVFLNIRKPKDQAHGDADFLMFDEAQAVIDSGEADGFIVRDGQIMEELVVFDHNQIKSAMGNTGAFSRDSDDIRHSQSPMKDTAANIRRGREAMNRAINDRADVKRAMYRNDIGWVDFVWGDTGKVEANGRTKGAMGLAHIIEARQRKDGMSYADVVQMLTRDVVETIAQGRELSNTQVGNSTAVKLVHNRQLVGLRKSKGSNAWMVTAFEVYEDANGKGYDNTVPTDSNATLSRVGTGASHAASDSNQAAGAVGLNEQGSNAALERERPNRTNRMSDTQAHSRRGRGLGADDTNNLPQTSRPVNENARAKAGQIRGRLKEVLGDKSKLIEVVDVSNQRPDDALNLISGRVEGWFSPKTGKITMIAETVTMERAEHVAWHELGHRGVAMAGWADYMAVMKQLELNKTVKSLADAIQGDRKGLSDRAARSRAVAIEEALVELYAAQQTGNYAGLESRYKVKIAQGVQQGMGGFFSRLAQRLRKVFSQAFKRPSESFSDADVYRILQEVGRNSTRDSGGLNGGGRYSPTESDLAQAKQQDNRRFSTAENNSFAETELKYGGREAYEQAKAAGETELNYRQWVQVRTPEFKAWFGDWENDPDEASKIINEDTGEPLVVYHATDADFNIFERNKLGKETYGNANSLEYALTAGVGHWFNSQDLNQTRNYGNRGVAAFLNIKEPSYKHDVADLAYDIGISGVISDDKQDFYDYESNEELNQVAEDFVDYLRIYEYADGVVVRGDEEYGGVSYVAFDANQIKSATDNTGAFDAANDDIRFSTAPATDDQRYLDLAERYEAGDKSVEDKLRKMVAAEARRKFGRKSKGAKDDKGRLKEVYHGTPNEFNEFSYDYMGNQGTVDGQGFYFTDSADFAELYQQGDGRVMRGYLDIQNTLSSDQWTLSKANVKAIIRELDPDGSDFLTNYGDVDYEGYNTVLNEAVQNELDFSDNDVDFIGSLINSGAEMADVYRALGKVKGKSGIVVPKDDGSTHYIATQPSQIKSSDFVTRDDAGNIIPLSERFNTESNDVRYSQAPQKLNPQEKRWFNEQGELRAGLAAYNKLGSLIKPVLARAKLANNHPDSFTRYMRDYRAQINVAGQTAQDIAEAGKTLTADERRLLSDVLEMELPEGVETSPEMQELAGAVREILSQQSDDLVALKMLSPESAERFRDTYLPRMYNKQAGGLFDHTDLGKMNREFRRAQRGKLGTAIKGNHLKGRGIFKEVPIKERDYWTERGFEVREDKGNGKLLMWRDYSRDERAQMGEERDAMLRFTSGYIKTQGDIAKGMLFNRIAEDGELSSNVQLEADWVQVPDTAIAGTGGVKRYGALAGKWVHPEVAYHLQQQFYIDGAMQKVWRSALGWWKLAKTVYNPVAHVNNVVSNIAMTWSAGGRLRDLVPMANEIRKKGALYREALELGLIGEAVDVAGLQEMFVGLNNAADDGQLMDTLIGRVLKRADKMALGIPGKVGDKFQTAYRVEDEVFKLALYKRGKERGLSPKEAADYALTFMFDYSEIPQGVKWVRDTGILPFISYTYKAMPAMARLALTRPHRMLAVTAAMYSLNALSYALLGGDADEDEEREYMPDYQKGFTSFGTPKLIRLPWNDSKGKPVFVDVYRWLPLGDFADTQNQMGGLPLPQWATPNGPVVNHAFALLGNKDTFTGREIVKPYMSDGEKAATYGKWLAQQWLPASVGVPYSYHTNNVLDGVKSQFEGSKMAEALEWMGYTGTNYRGEDKQLYRTLPGAFGVKLRGEKPQDMKAAQQRRTGYEIRELKADMGRIRRDNTLSDSTKDARLENRRKALQRLYDKMSD